MKVEVEEELFTLQGWALRSSACVSSPTFLTDPSAFQILAESS